jgi:Tfp pilus assembly protein PilV
MTARLHARSHGEAGFSLVEGMIAALILLFVILGVLPLVSQSMMNNLQGNDSTQQAQAAIDGLERFSSLPFSAEDFSVPAGSTSAAIVDVFSLESNQWLAEADFLLSGETARYTRTATVQYFGIGNLLLEGEDELEDPLDGGIAATDPGALHLKRVRVAIANERYGLDLTPTLGNYEVVLVSTY